MRRALTSAAAATACAILWCCTASSAEHVGTMHRIAKQQPANLTRNSVLINGPVPVLLTAYEIDGDGAHGAPGTVQPGGALFNPNSGALITDRQINVEPNGHYTTATTGAGHDAPSLVPVASGVLALYGAVSTYAAYKPPAAWSCGIAPACEPFKFAASTTDARTILDRLADSPEYLMPSVGISEASYASIGTATLIGGQQQPGSRYGEPGAQGYVAFDAQPGGGVFETAAGPWRFTQGAPSSDGLHVLTSTPKDDAYVDFGITRADPGAGEARLDIAGMSCTMRITSNGDASAAAAAIATQFSRSCSSMRPRLDAMQVRYDPAMVVDGRSLAPAVVGITARQKMALPAWDGVRLSCTGSIACASPHGTDTVADVRLSGLHRHFLFGGLLKAGPYAYYLMDVEQLTGSWIAKGQSSYGLALACFRTQGTAMNWVWTDCAGRHPFTLRPGHTPEDRLNGAYLIPGPQSYGGGMIPYVYDWSMGAQAAAPGAPVLAAVSLTQMPDGNLMFVHGCQTRDRATTMCFARYDPRSGRTVAAGTIAQVTNGGSLASVAVRTRHDGTVEAGVLTGQGDRFGCTGTGLCFLTYRFDAQRAAWFKLGSSSFGGRANAGFPGTVSVDGDRFVVQMHRLDADGDYDVEVQMRS